MARTSSLLMPSHRPRRSARIMSRGKPDEAEIDASGAPRSTRKRMTSSSVSNKKLKAAGKRTNLTSELGDDEIATQPLLSLGSLVRGTVLKRPSSQIKSPYVADVSLTSDSTTVLAHAPALDVGGMCVPGSEVIMSSRSPGGKTSHAIELVVSDAPLKNGEKSVVLVGAHPRLGELIALEVLKRGLLKDVLTLDNGFELGPVNSDNKEKQKDESPSAMRNVPGLLSNNTQLISLKQQVTLGDSRVDFEMAIHNSATNKSHRVIFEVKNVVCADYEKGTEPIKSGPNHCVVVTQSSDENSAPYRRTALFPWAKSRSQTFEDKKVCSARALKHLRNLQSLAAGDEEVTPVVLFVVNRSDCESIRACHEACPVFRDVLEEVTRDGAVRALGVRVRWTEDGNCYFDGVVPVKT